MRHNFTNSMGASPRTRSRSLSKCANAFASQRLHYERAARCTVDTGIVTCTIRGSVAWSLKFINCVYFSFLPVFKPFSSHALPETVVMHTHNADEGSLSHTLTHFALHVLFSAPMLTEERSYCSRLRSGSGFQERCVCSSTAELKWQRIVLYEPQDCL